MPELFYLEIKFVAENPFEPGIPASGSSVGLGRLEITGLRTLATVNGTLGASSVAIIGINRAPDAPTVIPTWNGPTNPNAAAAQTANVSARTTGTGATDVWR